MCGPVLAIAGMAFSALGAIQGMQAAQDQAKYEEAVQKNNNIMAERAKEDALQRGKREETLRRLQTTQDVGSQKSAIAAGGFDVNTGSALVKQSDIAAMGDIEALTIRSNAQREAYGINVSNAQERAASAGRVAGFKNKANSSLIGGATSVASQGFSAYQAGVFG